MSYSCLVCGGEMEKIGDGYEPWRCKDCGARASESCHGGLAFDAEYFDDDDQDYSEFACNACGNPAYPDCMSSCPLYDD